jgi:clan AA aspartic protease
MLKKRGKIMKLDTEIGKVVTTITIVNRGDQILAKRGIIAPNEVRSVTLNNVLVDTGATTLRLPAPIIQQLGLAPLKEVRVETANGISTARIFQDAKIIFQDREGTFECLELKQGATPLLGVIPLEALGIEIDLQQQILKLLPLNSQQTYLTIL